MKTSKNMQENPTSQKQRDQAARPLSTNNFLKNGRNI